MAASGGEGGVRGTPVPGVWGEGGTGRPHTHICPQGLHRDPLRGPAVPLRLLGVCNGGGGAGLSPPSPSRGHSRRGGGTPDSPSPTLPPPSAPNPAAFAGIPGSLWRRGGRSGTGVITAELEVPPTPRFRFPRGSIPIPAFPGPQVLPPFPGGSQAAFLGEVGSPWDCSEGRGAPRSQPGIPVGFLCFPEIHGGEGLGEDGTIPGVSPPPPLSSHGKIPVVVLSMLDFHGITHFQAIP